MTERNDLSRREFLKDAGCVVGGVALGSVALAAGCSAPGMTRTVTVTQSPTATGTTTGTTPGSVSDTFLFLNTTEVGIIKSVCARLIPGSAADPGAVEAKAYLYIDHALGGYYISQQGSYRRGLAALNAYAQAKNGKSFVELNTAQQDGVLADMQSGAATGFTDPTAPAFFATLLQHVREGAFCDPVYGGNYNLLGWKMVGFPGAQEFFADSQMVVGFDQATVAPITLTEEEAIVMPMPQNGF
jgi:gluconate 2-dehydrogenase gamma chain